jgi:hypothetical protein
MDRIKYTVSFTLDDTLESYYGTFTLGPQDSALGVTLRTHPPDPASRKGRLVIVKAVAEQKPPA